MKRNAFERDEIDEIVDWQLEKFYEVGIGVLAIRPMFEEFTIDDVQQCESADWYADRENHIFV